MLPSNIYVTKGREADSHLVLICSHLNYYVTCTCTITFMGGSQEAEIFTLVWIRWNNSMMENLMVWWKWTVKIKGMGRLPYFHGTVRTDLRGILSLPYHITTKIAAAHVSCPNQWCGVRCSCSSSKMIVQGWHKWNIVGRWNDSHL